MSQVAFSFTGFFFYFSYKLFFPSFSMHFFPFTLAEQWLPGHCLRGGGRTVCLGMEYIKSWILVKAFQVSFFIRVRLIGASSWGRGLGVEENFIFRPRRQSLGVVFHALDFALFWNLWIDFGNISRFLQNLTKLNLVNIKISSKKWF